MNEASQNQLRQQAIANLAVIGGQLTRDDDALFEGRRFVFPEQYHDDPDGMVRDVVGFADGRKETVHVEKEYPYLYLDGAHATYQMLVQHFGYARSVAKQGMFGPTPPSEVTIPMGYEDGVPQEITVPVGEMILPGMLGCRLTITSTRDTSTEPLRLKLVARVPRYYQKAISGFFQEVGDYLERHSIYKGKAFYGNMEFIDVDKIDPKKFVYSEQAQLEAELHIFSPMRDAIVLAEEGMEKRRVVLLEGGYGTGKSGLGRIAAKIAQANGWTAVIARPGQDDPFTVMEVAKLYQRAGSKGVLLFIEDVDTFASNADPMYVTRLLDAFDGVSTKDLEMVLVMTTNHKEDIQKGMLRPGRIHGMITIGEMDQAAVEKLAKMVVRNLSNEIDWGAVYEATIGYTPAFVREGLERAVRVCIARTRQGGTSITTIDLVRALDSVREQYNLMVGASDRKVTPSMDAVLRQMLAEALGVDYQEIEDRAGAAIYQKMENAAIVKPGSGSTIGVINTDG